MRFNFARSMYLTLLFSRTVSSGRPLASKTMDDIYTRLVRYIFIGLGRHLASGHLIIWASLLYISHIILTPSIPAGALVVTSNSRRHGVLSVQAMILPPRMSTGVRYVVLVPHHPSLSLPAMFPTVAQIQIPLVSEAICFTKASQG